MDNKRVGIYARVSTADQNTENQIIDLKRYADQRGWAVVGEYIDHGVSGAKERRPGLDKLMGDARRRKLDIVLVWKFDRWARSTSHLLNSLQEFNSIGIEFVSVEDSCDTTTPYGKAMFTIIGAMAELERQLIRERVINGVRKAQAKGTRFGRPKSVLDLVKVKQMYAAGCSQRTVAKSLGVSRMTLRQAVKAA